MAQPVQPVTREGRVERGDKVVERVENCEGVGEEEKKGIFYSHAKQRGELS